MQLKKLAKQQTRYPEKLNGRKANLDKNQKPKSRKKKIQEKIYRERQKKPKNRAWKIEKEESSERKGLKILQWNCNELYSAVKKEYLKNLLDKRIDIAMVQESQFTKNTTLPMFKDMNSITKTETS